MNVKITADGTPFGSRIMRQDGVELSDSIEAVSFSHEAGNMPRITMRFGGPFACGLEGSGEFSLIHPHTGEQKVLKAIEFADGERLEFPGKAEI